jgi:hypothetical protein
MRVQSMLMATSLTLLAGCGSAVGTAADELTSGSAEGSSGANSTCEGIASEYASAIRDAVVCDPSASDSCSAQRPLAVGVVEGGKRTIYGLCHVANAGYVNPSRTAALDELLVRYSGAGCRIQYCPGPAPHEPVCFDSGSGAPTCG